MGRWGRVVVGAVVLLVAASAPASLHPPTVDLVRAVKSERKLYLMSGGKAVHVFPIALGGNPRGHKRQEGDERTPEGRYELDFKNPGSKFYKSIRISYPNAQDAARARKRGVSPGGWVMIHGQKNGFGHMAAVTQKFDWTHGCIALRNADMDVVWQLVPVGTPIEIVP